MPQTINKILVVGPSWIGDMVMAQALFKALKKIHPRVVIDVLALAWTEPLLARMPEINEAITMPIGHGQFDWKMRKQIGRQLHKRGYNQAIVLPNSWKSALIPWFAKIPIRTGWRGELRYGLLNDIRTLNTSALPLMVQRYVSLAYPATQSNHPPDYPMPLLEATAPATAINPPLTGTQKRLVLCPGAEFGPAKQWPASHYAAVAQALLKQDWQVLILGSPADNAIATEILNHSGAPSDIINLCGKTQLGEAIDLLATADCVITNDSGLMHVAAALKKPLIALYGPTSPKFTPPLSDNANIMQIKVDCGPCFQRTCPQGHHDCMTHITSADVLTQVQELVQ